MASNKLNEIIATALQEMKSISDGNTIIGEPINLPSGTVIIPVSKVSMGIVSGGLDYNSKNAPAAKNPEANFGGGGATGLTISPICFLVASPDGKVESIGIESPSLQNPVSQATGMIESLPELIEKIKELFAKDGKKKKAKENEETEEAPDEEDGQ
ncbi:MAG: sporulation protein YtfJ [Clostridia bacterium]|nr:sporulation protein YtfJ [Clostridia bacterium]